MIKKRLEEIGKSEIDALIADEVQEGKQLDYKQELPASNDDAKKEFLADVTSFANASGGDLIFGVSEKRDAANNTTGLPKAVNGLAGVNVDAEIRRLENVIRDGIEPRIPSVHFKVIDGYPNGPVVVLRVERSYIAPHMVVLKNLSRFYSRNSAGKYQLDVSEIRSAFALSESLAEKLRHFRVDRLAKITSGESPVRIKEGSKLVLHLLPLTLPDSPHHVLTGTPTLEPLSAHGYSAPTHNFDGVMVYSGDSAQNSIYSYVQIFRNGTVEAVDTAVFGREQKFRFLNSQMAAEQIVRGVERFIKFQRQTGVQTPVYALLSLIEVKGVALWTPGRYQQYWGPLDRDALIFPEVVLEDLDKPVERLLLPVFDLLWQSFGLERCLDYDANGNRVGR